MRCRRPLIAFSTDEGRERNEGKLKVFSNGLLKENPSLRLVLGTCPTLAVTTLAVNGLGMGLAATFVLVCSNIAISALRKIIPDKVRLRPTSRSSPRL